LISTAIFNTGYNFWRSNFIFGFNVTAAKSGSAQVCAPSTRLPMYQRFGLFSDL